MDAEHRERKAANPQWMKQAFAEAKAKAADSKELVIMVQANPGFESFWPPAAKAPHFIPLIPRGGSFPRRPPRSKTTMRRCSSTLRHWRTASSSR